ncbi:MAG: hypothetical protein ACKV2Q_10855 [Planctomycetaceae bacterium]
MPRTASPKPQKAHAKKASDGSTKTPVVRLSDRAVAESIRRTEAARKSGVPRLAEDGVPWPPIPRVRGKGTLTKMELRRAVLTAMAASEGIDLADLEESLTPKPRKKVTKK